jgi:hypothetical protein
MYDAKNKYVLNVILVSISPTFYARLFSFKTFAQSKTFCTYILGLNYFWRKKIGATVGVGEIDHWTFKGVPTDVGLI